PTESELRALADAYALHFEWHPGFELRADRVPDHAHGLEIPALAPLPDWAERWDLPALGARIDREFGDSAHVLNAAILGRAFADLRRNPDRWAALGPPLVALQHLKLLWLMIVVCG